MVAQLRAEARWTAAALGAIALLVALSLVEHARGGTVPPGYVLLPVLALALVAGPVPSAVVGLVAAGATLLLYLVQAVADWPWRFVATVAIIALSVVGSLLRRRRDRALLEQAAAIAIARDHEHANEVVQRILEHSPRLSAPSTIEGVAALAVGLAVELFDADAASYWEVDGDEVVLYARQPQRVATMGTRLPKGTLVVPGEHRAGITTSWMDAVDPAEDPGRPPAHDAAVRLTGTAVDSSTPIVVDGQTMAYLRLSWSRPVARSDTTRDLIDRFAEQVALAKTIVRRRAAQARAAALTQRLQASLLPDIGRHSEHIAVHSLYRPGTRGLLLGGDFLDVAERHDQTGDLAFLIGDVSGHGPEPAALAVRLRAAWRALAALPVAPLSRWEAGMATVFSAEDRASGLFATLVMGVINAQARTLTYVCAGHPPPLLLCPDGTRESDHGGRPLGITGGPATQVMTVPLPPGAAVLLVTDGIFEGHVAPSDPRRVGWDDFIAFVGQTTASNPTEQDHTLLATLTDAMSELNGGPLDDDVAALLLRPY